MLVYVHLPVKPNSGTWGSKKSPHWGSQHPMGSGPAPSPTPQVSPCSLAKAMPAAHPPHALDATAIGLFLALSWAKISPTLAQPSLGQAGEWELLSSPSLPRQQLLTPCSRVAAWLLWRNSQGTGRDEAASRSTKPIQGGLHPSTLQARGDSGLCTIRTAPRGVCPPCSDHSSLSRSVTIIAVFWGQFGVGMCLFRGKILRAAGALCLLAWWEQHGTEWDWSPHRKPCVGTCTSPALGFSAFSLQKWLLAPALFELPAQLQTVGAGCPNGQDLLSPLQHSLQQDMCM